MKTSILTFALLFVLGISYSSTAQDGPFQSSSPFSSRKKDKDKDGDPDNNNGGGNNTSNVPFDGGVGALLVAGALYGVKKYRGHRNANTTS